MLLRLVLVEHLWSVYSGLCQAASTDSGYLADLFTHTPMLCCPSDSDDEQQLTFARRGRAFWRNGAGDRACSW